VTTRTAPAPAVVAAHVCARSTEEDDRFDYCPGCTAYERLCPSCDRFRPQSGWWWGAAHGRIDRWVCPDCRFPPLDAVAAARNPELAATHPALAELVAASPRFTTQVDVTDFDRRYEAAQALSRAAQALGIHGGAQVLYRMAAELRSADIVDTVEVDVSDVDFAGRQRVSRALHNAAYSTHTPQGALPLVSRLARSWELWTDGQLPGRDRPLPEADRAERERAAVRRNRERKVAG